MWTDTDYALEVGARIECVAEPAEDEWGVSLLTFKKAWQIPGK